MSYDESTPFPLHRRFQNLTSQTFHRLTVLAWAGTSGARQYPMWKCICRCGATVIVAGWTLTTGHTKSCGCLKREVLAQRKQGLKGLSEYSVWCAMKARCYRRTHPEYFRYGGRGVQVCPQWLHDPARFIKDMGPRPTLKHSIDRFPDKDGHYEPGNVRWATPKEQANNRRNNKV